MEQIGLLSMFGVCAFSDIRTKTVRVAELVVFAIIGVFIQLVSFREGQVDLPSILGGIVIGIIMYIISLLTNEKIGKGDALITMIAGLYLGFGRTMELLWIASIMVGFAGLYYLAIEKKDKSFELPFVPFLLMSYVVMFIGNIYMGLLA